MKRSHLYLYVSHSLSAWGDRMWMFAVGLFLVELSPGSLRLTASYGGASGGAILLLGALVGDWVDAKPRLKVARTSIAIQNISLCISAATTALVVIYRTEMNDIWRGLDPLCLTIIITSAVIADVFSVARQISIERDWIVVMCPGERQLTAMSALLRRIDLCTNILAPVATGQIITFTSTSTGALVIAGWNLVSLVLEYGMLYLIYKSVPELQYKNSTPMQSNKVDNEDNLALVESSSSHKYNNYGSVSKVQDTMIDPGHSDQNIHHTTTSITTSQDNKHQAACEHNPECDERKTSTKLSSSNNFATEEDAIVHHESSDPDTGSLQQSDKHEKLVETVLPTSWYHRLLQPFYILYTGWVVYMSQEMVLAGLALSGLYLTVLGFDNITVGYGKEQGLSEGLIGIIMSVGALVGIGGTLLYPVMRNKLGLAKTGTFAFILDVLLLTPCVVSIFVSGSPFQPDFLFGGGNTNIDDIAYNYSDVTTLHSSNSTLMDDVSSSYLSIILLMGGITISRAALWMGDLTVTQLLLEKPQEGQRGIVNGVQNSLNKVTDILKFILVILLPRPETFGYLVIASYLAIVISAVLYTVYACTHWGKDIPQARDNRDILQTDHDLET